MSTAQKNSAAYLVEAIRNTPKNVILAKADDWTALYVDGNKVLEDHSLSPDQIFGALGILVREIWIEEDWLEECGGVFPTQAAELPI